MTTQAIVIIGATGDLAQRMLFPSLYFLEAENHLAPDFRVIGAARTAQDKARPSSASVEGLGKRAQRGPFRRGSLGALRSTGSTIAWSTPSSRRTFRNLAESAGPGARGDLLSVDLAQPLCGDQRQSDQRGRDRPAWTAA